MTVIIIAAGVGCKPPPPPQTAREAQAAAAIRAALILYKNDFPERPITNLAQVFAHTSATGYPHHLDRWFRPYGEQAGFTNSFYERYVIVPPGVTDPRVPGEILLLNSRPFPDRQGRMQRVVVFEDPSPNIKIDSTMLPEDEAQRIFRRAGVQIPAPERFGKPPPGPPRSGERISAELIFQRLAQRMGLPRHYWFNVMLACIVGVLLIMTPAVWLLLRRAGR